MRAARAVLIFACVCASACSNEGDAPDDASVRHDLAPSPSTLILGLWQEPGSGYILRFTDDGRQELAATAGQLDTSPLLTGTWSITADRLTFVSATGLCASPVGEQRGIYVVTVTPSELTFNLDGDLCPERATIDGETWTRPATVDAGPDTRK